ESRATTGSPATPLANGDRGQLDQRPPARFWRASHRAPSAARTITCSRPLGSNPIAGGPTSPDAAFAGRPRELQARHLVVAPIKVACDDVQRAPLTPTPNAMRWPRPSPVTSGPVANPSAGPLRVGVHVPVRSVDQALPSFADRART